MIQPKPAPSLRLALVGGPAYDPFNQRLFAIAADLGITIDIAATAPHQELNEIVAAAAAEGSLPFDLISTHIKYAPSQQHWLRPLDDLIDSSDLVTFMPATIELCRFEGALWQLPRNVDARLLHIRRDWFDDEANRYAYAERFDRELRIPESWPELADIAAFFSSDSGAAGHRGPARRGGAGAGVPETQRPAVSSSAANIRGFAFPGRSSGLFGTFYELLVMEGGELLDADLEPVFDSPKGERALEYLRDLFLNGSVPRDLPNWHFDDVSAAFRDGMLAMVGDWPGYYGLHRDPAHSVAADSLAFARYPAGSTGKRKVYAGSHSFAITRDCRDVPAAFALLRAMTGFESQVFEAQLGAFPARQDALQVMLDAAPAGSLGAGRLDLLEQTVREDMLTFPELATYPDIEDAVWPLLQAAITGTLSVPVALSRAAAATRAIVRTT